MKKYMTIALKFLVIVPIYIACMLAACMATIYAIRFIVATLFSS